MAADIKTQIVKYLDICNQALRDRYRSPTIKKSLILAESIHEHHSINLTVYCGDPDSHISHFLINFRNRRFEFISEGYDASALQWGLKLRDIEKAVEMSETLVKEPEKFRRDSLLSRLGIDDAGRAGSTDVAPD